MRESLVYKLVQKGNVPGVEVDRNRFQEIYHSKYGKVRIYKILSVSKESKEYVADPANRVCDVPGSWFCPGQYPPALKKVLTIKKDFRQLEDFNAKGQNEDSDYQKQYLENVHGGQHRGSAAKPHQLEVLSSDKIDRINDESEWKDNEATTEMWQLISEDKHNDLVEALSKNPRLAHIRSSDGRGPMFWAYENNRKDIILALKTVGVLDTRKDAKGIMAKELQYQGGV
jgi:dolichyl-diphosphooligosaccharide--protein glycosyltransferase